jgi:hypothetical protein
MFSAIEVEDVGADGLLSSELDAGDASPAEVVPEKRLGVRLLAAARSR